MPNYQIYYKRNLPHYQPQGYTFFVTFRLSDSLPLHVIKRLQADQESKLEQIAAIINDKDKQEAYWEYQQNYFEEFDYQLDRYEDSPKWLGDERIASIVKEAIHYRDEKIYNLIAYTIMPNHVHIIFTPIVKHSTDNKLIGRTGCSTYIVTDILKSLKWYSALNCNKILVRTGAFWQHESYDHVVRNSDELKRLVEYILYNPVKAGLCENWDEWKWSYCNFEKLSL